MVGSGRIFPAVSVSPDPSVFGLVMNLACSAFPPKISCSESLFVRAGSCVRFLWNFSFFQSLNENILAFHRKKCGELVSVEDNRVGNRISLKIWTTNN